MGRGNGIKTFKKIKRKYEQKGRENNLNLNRKGGAASNNLRRHYRPLHAPSSPRHARAPRGKGGVGGEHRPALLRWPRAPRSILEGGRTEGANMKTLLLSLASSRVAGYPRSRLAFLFFPVSLSLSLSVCLALLFLSFSLSFSLALFLVLSLALSHFLFSLSLSDYPNSQFAYLSTFSPIRPSSLVIQVPSSPRYYPSSFFIPSSYRLDNLAVSPCLPSPRTSFPPSPISRLPLMPPVLRRQ